MTLSFEHAVRLDENWDGEAAVEYELIGDEETFYYGARLDGAIEGWSIDIEASRTIVDDDDESDIEVTERIPEIAVSGPGTHLWGIDVRPTFALGQYREWVDDVITASALRLQGGMNATVSSFRLLGVTISPTGSARATRYETEDGTQYQTAVSGTLRAAANGVSVSYSATAVSGGSPFEFDATETSQQLSWSVTRSGAVRLVVSGGIDVDEGSVDPMQATLTWGDAVSWRLAGEWDVAQGLLASTTLIGQWAGDGGAPFLEGPVGRRRRMGANCDRRIA